MYEPIRDIDPRWRQIHRWIWLAMPDDAAQEVRLAYIEYPILTDTARAALISDRLRELARQCWRMPPSRSIHQPRYRISPMAPARGEHRWTPAFVQRASGQRGGFAGAATRWGGFVERRDEARRMRAAGKTLREIAESLGYGSVSAASYAARQDNPTRRKNG